MATPSRVATADCGPVALDGRAHNLVGATGYIPLSSLNVLRPPGALKETMGHPALRHSVKLAGPTISGRPRKLLWPFEDTVLIGDLTDGFTKHAGPVWEFTSQS